MVKAWWSRYRMKCDYCTNNARWQKHIFALCDYHKAVLESYQWVRIK